MVIRRNRGRISVSTSLILLLALERNINKINLSVINFISRLIGLVPCFSSSWIRAEVGSTSSFMLQNVRSAYSPASGLYSKGGNKLMVGSFLIAKVVYLYKKKIRRSRTCWTNQVIPFGLIESLLGVYPLDKS